MKSPVRTILALAVAAGLAAPTAAFATNGYFGLGYGTKQFGMGGAGVAYPQDALAAATNPAGMAFVGNRVDIGMELFNPERDASLGASSHIDSGATLFAVPSMGAVLDQGPLAYGVSVYGNGGMSTRYSGADNLFNNTFKGLPGFGAVPNTGTLGINLSQLLIAPTVAYKVLPGTSIGVSPLIAVQTFRAYGLGDFANQIFSLHQGHVTNQGNDYSYGGGVRVGVQSNLTNWLSVGATWASKVYMSKLDKYRGLFADGGSFDIPSQFAVGLALKPTPSLVVAFDVQRIMYGQVPAIANPGPTGQDLAGVIKYAYGMVPTPPNFGQRRLGAAQGMGFGWRNITVYKVGVAYDVNDRLTVRAGFDYTDSPIPNDQLLFNILAPGVIKYTGTLGLTYKPTQNQAINIAYMHAARHSQSSSISLGALGAMPVQIGMYENALEVGYGWKF
ncbi:outer membrane protein transport protein [bacterium BMS3Abin12]|nr:outer membrane protein transport protein [bacterium BMS3Abin12]